jgi:hypothetical protein
MVHVHVSADQRDGSAINGMVSGDRVRILLLQVRENIHDVWLVRVGQTAPTAMAVL